MYHADGKTQPSAVSDVIGGERRRQVVRGPQREDMRPASRMYKREPYLCFGRVAW